MSDKRLTPEEFKATFKQKGWTGRSLARRWGISEEWVSKLMKDPDRPPHWDDAVRGIPDISTKD